MPVVNLGPLDAVVGFQLNRTMRGTIEIEGWQHKTYQWCYALFVTDRPIEWNGRRVRVKGLTSGHRMELTAQVGSMGFGLSGLPPPRYFFPVEVKSQYPKPGGGDVPTPGTYHDAPCRQYFPWSDGEEAIATLID
ncbi:MAG: hypothetical protein HQK87_10975 [Nitrospinae bacterium]|nr:hypothetical protein [Nitrospinota bacterium]